MKKYLLQKFSDGSINIDCISDNVNIDSYALEAGAIDYFLIEKENLEYDSSLYVIDFSTKTLEPIASNEYKVQAKQKVIEYALQIEEELTAGYTQGEVSSWPAKLDAAYAYLAGTPTNAQRVIIETEAAEKNVLPNDLCNAIINKGEWYSEATALIASLRSNTFKAIDAAKTELEVDTILQNALTYANQKWVDLISRMP